MALRKSDISERHLFPFILSNLAPVSEIMSRPKFFAKQDKSRFT